MTELKNPGPIEFEAKIVRAGSEANASAFVDFPLDLKETFGKDNLVPIVAIFDGQVTYKGSLAKMGGELACLIIRKDIQTQLGKKAGDTVRVIIELDSTKREIILDADEKKALKSAGMLGKFESLAYSHQKEFHAWVIEAKQAETRKRRLAKMVEMLRNGQNIP